MIRVLFLGTPDFAVPSLQSLLRADRLDVVGVITQPDRRAGRGQHLRAPPVKRLALRHHLPLLQPRRIRNHAEVHEFARRMCPDVMAVVAFGQILPASFFDIPPFGCLNVHASLLPRHRGAAPVAYALLCGDSESGVTIMKIDEGMDTGDILTARKVTVGPDTTAGELSEELAQLGGELLSETIPRWVDGEIQAQPQDESEASYAPRLDKSQSIVDWTRRATSIHNLIRAFNPWPGAACRLGERWIKLWGSCHPQSSPTHQSSPPGTVIGLDGDELRVVCGEHSSLGLTELQAPNRRRMTAHDFVNGRQIRIGDRFHGPDD